MKESKKILLFSDLEGTILRECDSKYDQEAMYQFLGQIDRLQQVTESRVYIHLVSPVRKEDIEKIMDEIDSSIVKYNLLHRDHVRIPEIACGGFAPQGGASEVGKRTIPLKMPRDSKEIDTSKYGKANYVRQWCEMHKGRDELLMAIYCGNGRNDLSAMDYIREQKEGFVICPSNTNEKVKAKANFVSGRTNLQGVAEGIEKIIKEIEKRTMPEDFQEKKEGWQQ